MNVDDEVVAMGAQFGDRRRDRLEIAPMARFLEAAQRRGQHAVHALAPMHHFGECFVGCPVHFHAGKRAFDVGDDRQRLHDIAE
jgi:hypothetical protein